MDLTELGQEYASIVGRQETGKDMFGNVLEKYQPGDRERLSEIEAAFKAQGDYTLSEYVENWLEIQKDNLS